MTKSVASNVAEIREFNRFYTKILGLLNQRVYESSFSLTEIRMLFEINNITDCTAKILQEELGLDRGYVSRTIKHFEKQNLIYRQRWDKDGRTYFIYLTEKGKSVFYNLENRANKQIEYLITNLDVNNQKRLIESMQTIKMSFSKKLDQKKSGLYIRDEYDTEDIAHIIEKQRAFYADGYEFDKSFLNYLHSTFHAKIDKIWIAENDGVFAGCIGLVKETEEAALLRWFLVETSIRGKGVGTQLVKALLHYCKEQYYKKVSLWTISELLTARKLYSKFGFKLVETKKEQPLWGKKIVEERWELEL